MNDGYGLDKGARLTAKHEADAEADKPPPLEPEFPWVCEAFDPGFFDPNNAAGGAP
jgi:hypothetical protein